MAVDTYTARARYILMGTGNDLNVWGQYLNVSAIQLIEDSIMGAVTLNVSGPVTLSAANGATDQSRMAILTCTGTGGTITTPGVQKTYQIDASQATGNIVITTGSGASATVEAGNRIRVSCPDGINWYLFRDTAIATTASNLTTAYQSADTATLNSAKTYTDSKTLGQTTLPGSSQPGAFIWTDPVSGNAAWHIPVVADVSGLSAALAANQTSDRNFTLSQATALAMQF